MDDETPIRSHDPSTSAADAQQQSAEQLAPPTEAQGGAPSDVNAEQFGLEQLPPQGRPAPEPEPDPEAPADPPADSEAGTP